GSVLHGGSCLLAWPESAPPPSARCAPGLSLLIAPAGSRAVIATWREHSSGRLHRRRLLRESRAARLGLGGCAVGSVRERPRGQDHQPADGAEGGPRSADQARGPAGGAQRLDLRRELF